MRLAMIDAPAAAELLAEAWRAAQPSRAGGLTQDEFAGPAARAG
ncbi:hypothetical protein [Caulobacter hibisci]|nr:hypothetical protein [Caulobacter hibisci]